MSVTVETPSIPAQRTPSAAGATKRQPHGYSRPDCGTCQERRKRLVASYDTPDEDPAWKAWVGHMNEAHPSWRNGPTFPQSIF